VFGVTRELVQPAVAVPFLDLAAIHAPLKERVLHEFGELIDSGAFTGGPAVRAFEDAFASYCRAPVCVGVASGLDALRLGLLASGLEPGDEVVIPAGTFVATAEAVTQAGGMPVLADISEADYCLDAEAAAAAISDRTRSVMPVHLYGQLADMCALSSVAARAGVSILEDACQAHGAERDGVRAGSSGHAAAFSFYPGKNLGAAGDAGALVTGDADLAARMRALREHGQTAKYVHAFEGWTARLDTIQAIFLSNKLPLLDDWNEQRRAAAAFYGGVLRGVGDLKLPPVPHGSDPVWHLYVVRTADPPLSGTSAPHRGVRGPWLCEGCLPGRRGAVRGVPLFADVPGDRGGATRSSCGRCARLLQWLRLRQMTCRTASSTM
jgi:dTDP-4-amino-4,6-dideoxygalactose transaminase